MKFAVGLYYQTVQMLESVGELMWFARIISFSTQSMMPMTVQIYNLSTEKCAESTD